MWLNVQEHKRQAIRDKVRASMGLNADADEVDLDAAADMGQFMTAGAPGKQHHAGG